MNGTATGEDGRGLQAAATVAEIRSITSRMQAWLKFLGGAFIFTGAFAAVVTVGVGLLFAWIPIWLGIILIQAGGRAASFERDGDPEPLIEMFEKLRTYFVAYAVAAIVGLTFMIILTIFVAVYLGDMNAAALREFVYF